MSLRLPGVETLSEARAEIVEPTTFFAKFQDSAIKVYGVPQCISKNVQDEVKTLYLSTLDKNGTISLEGFTTDYIRHFYLAKSNRCKDCQATKDCEGLPINTIRVHGFKQLKPF